jgi:hypothetical protein
MQEQVAEVARPLRVLQGLAQGRDIQLLHPGFADVEDEPGVAAVEVVAPPEQGGVFVEQAGLQRRYVFGHAVNLLKRVRLQNVMHAAQQMGLVGQQAGLDEPELPGVMPLRVHAAGLLELIGSPRTLGTSST